MTNKNLQIGKIPPQAVDLEEAVLGGMMVDKNGLEEAISILSPEVFYKPAHQEIFKAIRILFDDSQPIDLLTIADKLRREEKLDSIGGDYFLIQLSQKVSSSAHIEFHSRILQEKFLLRKLIEISSKVVQKAYDGVDVFELLDYYEESLDTTKLLNSTVKVRNFQQIIQESTEKLKLIAQGKQEAIGIPIKLKELKRILGGWKNTFSYILAARPGMGKNILANQIIVDNARTNIKTGIISLEMSDTNLGVRIITATTGIPNQYFERKKADKNTFSEYFKKIREVEDFGQFIYIDDEPFITPQSLSSKISTMVKKFGIQMLIIDYLQLISNEKKGANREQQINEISRNIKLNAKKYNIPILTLCQLSRAVETRGGSKRPQLSDLRESGAIEQDADVVLFLYRPEYYNFDTWDDQDSEDCAGQMEIMVSKHRGGALDNARVGVDIKTSSVFNLGSDDEFYYSPVEPNNDLAF